MTPYFSIITPIYNKSDCIEKTVTSLLSQTFSNIEIILVDDHSSDDTFSKIKKLAKQDVRIKAIQHKKNLGVHQARNTGVGAATGKYILFLDGDDYFETNTCNTIYETIQSHEADVYEFNYYILPEKKENKLKLDDRDRVSALLSEINSYPATIWNKAYKAQIVKKAFKDTPFIPQNGPEDLYEAIIMAFYTTTYYHINIPLYNYSTGSGISTRKRTFHDNEIYFSNMKFIIELIKVFFTKKKSKYVNLIPQLEGRLVRDAIGWFISNLTVEEDKNRSYLLLSRYFSIESLLPYFDFLSQQAQKYNQGKWNIINFLKNIKHGVKNVIQK